MKRNKIGKALALVTLAIAVNAKSYAVQFYDTLGTKYENAAEILAELSIVKGVKDNVFDYNKEVTRAEFAKMLVEASFKDSELKALTLDDSHVNFKDVSEKEWYYPYVTVVVNRGFMEGFGDGTFRPDEGVTYSQIAKLVTKALGHDYLTSKDPANWDEEYVLKMYEFNLFKDVSMKELSEKATRGNCAIIIWNMLTTNTWKMINRNDQAGFTYVDSGTSLFNQKILDHEYLLNVQIDGFKEINGDLCVNVKGRYYKMFDQKSKINYSMVKGYSDVIFKRVEYPGRVEKLEVAYIGTDIGSKLYSGTYKELTDDGFSLAGKTRLSENADYAYIYHYENGEKDDRIVAVNTGNFIYVDSIKVTDESPEESGDKKTVEKDKSHSEYTEQFQDDPINYRYSDEEKEFTRSININEDELIIEDGAVLFYDNQRIDWKDVKKNDILVEITKDKYYMLTKSHSITTKLLDYNTKKNESTITTTELTYETYPSTTYTSYTSNTKKVFNNLPKKELDNLKNRKVKLTFDTTDRIIEVELLEDDISLGDFNIGFYDQFHFAEEFGEKTNSITFIIDGKKKTYPTALTKSEFTKGSFVIFKFDEKDKRIVKSVEEVKDNTKISDKLSAVGLSIEELKNKLEFFEDDEIDIIDIKYHYELGKYEKPISYETNKMTIKDVKKLKGDTDSYACIAIADSSDVYRMFVIKDTSEIGNTFYGLVKKIVENKKRTKDEKTGEKIEELVDVHIFIQKVNNKTTDEYVFTGINKCEVGDFIYYKPGDSDKDIQVIEKYTPSIMGYEKDYKITAVNRMTSNKKVVSYELNNSIKIDNENYVIKDGKREYDLEEYEIFLLKVAKTSDEKWEFKSAESVNLANFTFEEGDMLAFDEIEGTLIIYRGYTK